MAEAILADHHPRPPPSDIDTGEFDPLPIPPFDSMFLSAQADTHMAAMEENLASDLHFSLDDNYDLDITFDDLDEFYFPSENEHFSIANELDVSRQPEDYSDSIESGSSAISSDRVSDVGKYLNCSPSGSRCSDSGCQSSYSAAQLNSSSPVSSSHVSGVSEAMNAASPDSDSGAIVVDQKVKTEVNVKKCSLPKRKKEISCEDTNGEARNQKYLRSENSNMKTDVNNSNSNGSFVAAGDDDEKRKARLMRNRESAQLSRQRKKHYVEELEDKVRSMHSTIADLNSKISFFMAENASLRQQLSGNGICNPQMYPPMAPMPYPWMPCAPYVVKSQGSQVPLVPIPRLKPQQPVFSSKPKKAEGKKGEGKSKKVASVSFLGLLFFVLLFGGMVPIVNVKYGGVRENGANGFGFGSDKYYDTQRGRVLMVDGHSNGSHEKTDIDGIHCGGRGRDGRVEHSPSTDNFVNLNDSSKQLAASLYVPRNDKLVKIDGNLIIHSVLATEKAMASHDASEVNKNTETSLALPKDFSPALAVPGVHSHSDVSSNRGVHPQRYRTPNEGHNALPSRSSETLKDQLKSSAANGKLQQWFHEGLAGPLLSSGMCTEVFQFDSSPAPGAIVAATSVANITSHRQQNATRHTRAKNRRFLHGLQIPFSGSDLNITGEHVPTSQKDKFQGNKSVSSSMVVSVLVDPRENSDTEVDGVIKPKSLSRIFVVVLLDSVKYVTYSCMLPRPGPHLVTT